MTRELGTYTQGALRRVTKDRADSGQRSLSFATSKGTLRLIDFAAGRIDFEQ
jgi:hypothetical protein